MELPEPPKYKPEIPKFKPYPFINLNPPIPELKPIEDKRKINVRYPLILPFAFAHIYWNNNLGEVVYDVEEPLLNADEKNLLDIVKAGLQEIINIGYLGEKTQEEILEYIDKLIKIIDKELNLNIPTTSYPKIFYYVYRDFIGFNEIEPLLKDYFIEDIECNGIKDPVYVVHRIYKNLRTNIVYNDMNYLASFVEKLAQRCGKYISYANPLLDGTLPDGSLDYNEPFIYREKGIIKVSKIGKFVDRFYSGNSCNVPVKVKGIEVPAFDHKTLKLEWKKVDYVYRHKVDEPLYRLKLEFGRNVTLTGAHSLFVLTKEGIKAERTSNIKEGDYVVIPLRIPEGLAIKELNLAKELAKTSYHKKIVLANVPSELFDEKKKEIKDYLEIAYKRPYQAYYELRKKKILPLKLWTIIPENLLRRCKLKTTSHVTLPTYVEISKELMRLLGYYIAEGWTSETRQKSIEFCLNAKEKDLIKDIKHCLKKCFDIKPYVEKQENSVKIRVNSVLAWLMFNHVLKVSHYAKTKEVPEIVFNVSRELREEFLKAWHARDFGSIASEKLAEDISYLCLLNDKVVSFYDRTRALRIENRQFVSHECYTNFFRRPISNFPSLIPIEIFNSLNQTHYRLRNKRIARDRLMSILEEKRYKRFEDLTSASTKFLREWEKRGFVKDRALTAKGLEALREAKLLRKLISSDLGFARVKKIERVKSSSQYVYDVSVAGHENFIGGFGGVCCHNSRVNATYTTEITSKGPTFTIRKFTKIPWTPTQLIGFKTVSPEMMAYFWIAIQYKMNILITGGTGSGKTTLLNALAFFIPPEARVISIEDTRELNLPRENWLPSVARTGVGGIGEIDLFTLLKESFRQRPDYVIVGEVRGKEAYVLFQGMASGHPSISTIHADSVETVIKRLQTPPISLSPTLLNMLDILAIMQHALVKGQETRKLGKVVEIIRINEDGTTLTNTPFLWNPSEDKFYYKTEIKIFEKIKERYGIPKEELQKEFAIRTRLLYNLYLRNIFDFYEIQRIINLYYKNKEEVLKKFL
jgi:type IV secretory pathway ATPase VirB11/archaellum biosynthesis ATPase/intein/homing endonuclease